MTMRKVAYNARYGGFGLSEEAVNLGRKLSGDDNWANATLPGERSGPTRDWGGVRMDDDFPRHDPVLIEVIETLGKEANGTSADLQIKEVVGPYCIDECDGFEAVYEFY